MNCSLDYLHQNSHQEHQEHPLTDRAFPVNIAGTISIVASNNQNLRVWVTAQPGWLFEASNSNYGGWNIAEYRVESAQSIPGIVSIYIQPNPVNPAWRCLVSMQKYFPTLEAVHIRFEMFVDQYTRTDNLEVWALFFSDRSTIVQQWQTNMPAFPFKYNIGMPSPALSNEEGHVIVGEWKQHDFDMMHDQPTGTFTAEGVNETSGSFRTQNTSFPGVLTPTGMAESISRMGNATLTGSLLYFQYVKNYPYEVSNPFAIIPTNIPAPIVQAYESSVGQASHYQVMNLVELTYLNGAAIYNDKHELVNLGIITGRTASVSTSYIGNEYSVT